MKQPKLSSSQRAVVLGDERDHKRDSVVMLLAQGIGKYPWRSVSDTPLVHSVKDFDGNELFKASPGIAHKIVTAVNAYPKLLGDVVGHIDTLRALQVQLRELPTSPARDRLIELVDANLHPEKS